MSASAAPTNRKQRRAAAKQKDDDDAPTPIPLAHPDRSTRPAAKSLFDLAAEREAELRAQADALNAQRTGGRLQHLHADDDAEAARDADHILTTLFYAITLSIVHFTLDFLVWHQYGQEIDYSLILRRLAYLFPVLLLLIYLAHTRTASKLPTLRRAAFASAAVGAGCRLLWIGNQQAFLGVMKNSAPTAVIWIWCIIEMPLLWALGSLLPVGAYILYNGFSIW